MGTLGYGFSAHQSTGIAEQLLVPCGTQSAWSSARDLIGIGFPYAVPHGKHADGAPLKFFVERTPFGPSDVRSEGMPCSGMALVCQKSMPVESVNHHGLVATH